MLLTAWLWTKPTLEVCKSIIMLRDSNISGRLSMKDMPALLNMLLFWKVDKLQLETKNGWSNCCLLNLYHF